MKKWLEFCNLTQLDVLQVPYLCNEHFEDKFILKKQQKTLLHGYAIPTIIVQHSVNLLNTEEPLKKKRARNCYLCGPTVLHLHQFPKDDVRRSEWFKALNISVDKCEDLKLCSNHFSSDSSLITPNGKIKLKPNARPDKMIQMLNDDNRFTKIVQTDRGTGCNAFNDNDAAVFLDISGVSGTSVEENTALSVGTEEQPSESNPKDVCGNNSTPKRAVTNISSKLNIRYIGDINTPSLESPRTRRKCLSVIRTHKLVMGEQVRKLKRQNIRLKTKMNNLRSLLYDLRQKNLITEEAETILLVNFRPIYQHCRSQEAKELAKLALHKKQLYYFISPFAKS